MAASPVHPQIPAWGRVRPRRRFADRTLKILCALFTGIGIFVLGWILGMLFFKGLTALSPRVFTQVTPGPGSEGGGLANAIVGSLILTFSASWWRHRSACSPAPSSPSTATAPGSPRSCASSTTSSCPPPPS
jgi:hypothetical protein